MHTVGVGGPRAVMRVPGLVATNLRQVPAAGLNETLLRAMATATSGVYRAAADAAAFAAAMEEIDTFERSEFRVARLAVAHDVFMPWLLTGMSLVCLAALLESTVLLGLP